MANEGHLARLRSGVKDWNAWRKELRDLTPDLNEDGSHFVGVTPSEWRDVRAILRKVPLCLVKDYYPNAYHNLVKELANEMWIGAGSPGEPEPLNFWAAAEQHIWVLVNAVESSAVSRSDAAMAIEKFFRDFSPEDYLGHIRTLAYFTWENAGRPYGQALTMWLYAEHWVLDHIATAGLTHEGALAASGSQGH